MRKVNLLNRCTRLFLFCIVMLTQLCGLTTFVYDLKRERIYQSNTLRAYSIFVLVVLTATVMSNVYYMIIQEADLSPLIGYYVILVVRVQNLVYSGECVQLLNEMLRLVGQLQTMAKHPNIFRGRHLLLLVLALHTLVRSLIAAIDRDTRQNIILLLIPAVLMAFLLQITINICLFVVLIACYQELHLCTRRISNDVAKVRRAQPLDGVHLSVLVEQLRGLTEELIMLRSKVFHISRRLIKHFRFHWLCAMVHGLIPFVFITAIEQRDLYFMTTSALNIVFYFTIFEMLSWESRLSRSFWHFHLTNYQPSFDRTIDVLIHQEISEHIKISVYEITLDMKFLFRVLSISIFFIFVNTQSYWHRHR
ncbi:GL13240 [Drosophila persimilis]|uniref:GL13240 n=1 Tax=Drosophila persimilis TaxID=7234 RepID=B4H7A1_DROPE|nr:uncharacterized protein CG32395 [Drosophila persimilis]EDW33707.1 GL13240 [Drosophila persimilis]